MQKKELYIGNLVQERPEGKLVEVKEGAVNGIVKIDIGGANVITSSITNNAIKELGLEEGSGDFEVIKASNVMVGVDE